MNCKQVQNKLIFYYYGELPQAEMTEIKQHLAECASCREQYNKLSLTLDYAQRETELSAPENLWQDINNQLDSTRSQTAKVLRIRVAQTLAAAAAIAIAIFIGSLMGKTFAEKSYPVATREQQYEDYDSLVQTFSSLDASVYVVLDK